jgi:hypothetical protein
MALKGTADVDDGDGVHCPAQSRSHRRMPPVWSLRPHLHAPPRYVPALCGPWGAALLAAMVIVSMH